MENFGQIGKCTLPKIHQNIENFSGPQSKQEFEDVFKELALRMAPNSYGIFETFKKQFMSMLTNYYKYRKLWKLPNLFCKASVTCKTSVTKIKLYWIMFNDHKYKNLGKLN